MKIEPVRGTVRVEDWEEFQRGAISRLSEWNEEVVPVGPGDMSAIVHSLTPESIEAMREKVHVHMKALASPKEILAAIGITEEE